MATREEIVVELDALLVGFCVISVREYARQADRSAENLDAKLLEKSKVLVVSVIEVDAMPKGVMLGVLHVDKSALELGGVHAAVGLHGPLLAGPRWIKVAQILRVEPLAPLVPSTFCLGTCHRTSPEEALRKTCRFLERLEHDSIPVLKSECP